MAVTGNNLDFDSFQLFIDDIPVLITVNYNYTYTAGVLTYQVTTELDSGVHKFQAQAKETVDLLPVLSVAQFAYVGSSSLELDDPPIVYPSPATSSARICYSLSHGADIDVCIYDLKGQMVHHQRLANGAEGAHAGYNQYPYDLTYADARPLPNGVFIVLLVQRSGDKNTILGKRKFMVLRDEK